MLKQQSIQRGMVAIGFVALSLGQARIALAQELEEITVTAQKREQSSQDVPLTISTLSGAELAKANIRGWSGIRIERETDVMAAVLRWGER